MQVLYWSGVTGGGHDAVCIREVRNIDVGSKLNAQIILNGSAKNLVADLSEGGRGEYHGIVIHG